MPILFAHQTSRQHVISANRQIEQFHVNFHRIHGRGTAWQPCDCWSFRTSDDFDFAQLQIKQSTSDLSPGQSNSVEINEAHQKFNQCSRNFNHEPTRKKITKTVLMPSPNNHIGCTQPNAFAKQHDRIVFQKENKLYTIRFDSMHVQNTYRSPCRNCEAHFEHVKHLRWNTWWIGLGWFVCCWLLDCDVVLITNSLGAMLWWHAEHGGANILEWEKEKDNMSEWVMVKKRYKIFANKN